MVLIYITIPIVIIEHIGMWRKPKKKNVTFNDDCMGIKLIILSNSKL